ncbi:hypothetical protein [Williamsia muralis]|uniref:hypothetical protein n=1 Tax=Williamsia marianensis TaxID=85044 RepID=UPI000DE5C786|nr:hypothetical protein [Williamsia marianensis]PVY32279.1 hypothetical protein C7458_10222 [Williamsia marianensis]
MLGNDTARDLLAIVSIIAAIASGVIAVIAMNDASNAQADANRIAEEQVSLSEETLKVSRENQDAAGAKFNILKIGVDLYFPAGDFTSFGDLHADGRVGDLPADEWHRASARWVIAEVANIGERAGIISQVGPGVNETHYQIGNHMSCKNDTEDAWSTTLCAEPLEPGGTWFVQFYADTDLPNSIEDDWRGNGVEFCAQEYLWQTVNCRINDSVKLPA